MTEDFSGKYNWDGKTILIVEDDISSIFYLKEILKDSGVDLLFAEDGKKAISVFKDHSEINLILMDIQLPVLNGYETTRKIKSLNPNLPVIAQTAYAMPEERIKCLEAGCNDYLAKPLDPNLLLQKISVLI